MTEVEAEMAFETEDMLIVPPQIELQNIRFGLTDYQNARQSRLKKYTSRDIKPLSKAKMKNLLLKNNLND